MRTIAVAVVVAVAATVALVAKASDRSASAAALEPALACLRAVPGLASGPETSSSGTRQIRVVAGEHVAYVTFFGSAEEAQWWSEQIASGIRAAAGDPAGLNQRQGAVLVSWGSLPPAATKAAVAGCVA